MADFYVDATDAGTWLTERGLPALGDAHLLLVAAEYIDRRYGRLFPGVKAGGRAQVREWPRSDATDCAGEAVSGIPREVIDATMEIVALLASGAMTAGDLMPQSTPAQRIASARIDGAVAVSYQQRTSNRWGRDEDDLPVVSAAELALGPLIDCRRGGFGVRLISGRC